MLSRFLRGLHLVEDRLLALLVTALLALSLTEIGLRMFFNSGLDWAEPVSRVGVLWLALLGALSAARAKRHIAIDALPKILPPPLRRVAWILSQAATAAICGMMAWYSYGMVVMERAAPSQFAASIPSWWPMLIMPVGFALLSLRFAVAACGAPHEPGAE